MGESRTQRVRVVRGSGAGLLARGADDVEAGRAVTGEDLGSGEVHRSTLWPRSIGQVQL